MGLSPRVRGNRISTRSLGQHLCQGLSPRVRGNLLTWPGPLLYNSRGLSPRVRGNPGMFRLHPTVEPFVVYPRVCGGTLPAGDVTTASSEGSIPACAGEPFSMALDYTRAYRGLSPRVRGNRRPRCPGSCRERQGLSPRVRGNLPQFYRRQTSPATGLSPRVRGNHSEAGHLASTGIRVYPRVCGGTA